MIGEFEVMGTDAGDGPIANEVLDDFHDGDLPFAAIGALEDFVE